MRSKSFITFLIVLVALLGVVLIKKGLRPKVPTTEPLTKIVYKPVNKDKATNLLITFGKKKIAISKKGDEKKATVGSNLHGKDQRWVIADNFGAYADEQKVDSFISMIGSLKGELRSDNKDLLSDYGIADNEGIHVEVKNGPSLVARIVLGSKKAGSENDFVRLEGSTAVYAVDKDILSYLGLRKDIKEEDLKADIWIDKSIVAFDPSKVTSIKLGKNKQQYIGLVKEVKDKKELWKSLKNYPINIDQAKVNNFIKMLTRLKARSVVPPKEDGGFSASDWKVSIGLDNGTNLQIIRGKKDKNDYYVKVSDKDYSFKAPGYVLDNLDKTDGDFFVNNPLGVNDSDVKEVMIKNFEDKKVVDVKRSDALLNDGKQKKQKPVWMSSSGSEVKADEVKDILNKIKGISIKTLPEKTQSVEDLLAINLRNADGSTQEYQISKSIKINNDKEGNYFVIKNDANDYYVDSYVVDSLKTAIAPLGKGIDSKKVKAVPQKPSKQVKAVSANPVKEVKPLSIEPAKMGK